MSEYLTELQCLTQRCEQCKNVVTGYLIPDGRFVCPQCYPAAVVARWQREWGVIETAQIKEQKRIEPRGLDVLLQNGSGFQNQYLKHNRILRRKRVRHFREKYSLDAS